MSESERRPGGLPVRAWNGVRLRPRAHAPLNGRLDYHSLEPTLQEYVTVFLESTPELVLAAACLGRRK